MDRMMRKMKRYVNSTVSLYSEMEVMNELELTTKKFQQNQLEESRKAFEQKLMWQRQDVKHLKDASLWNQTYDKVVELLARTTCTVYARIHTVFGDSLSKGNYNIPISTSQVGFSGSTRHWKQETVQKSSNSDFNFVCGIRPGRLFMDCLSLRSSFSKGDEDDHVSYDDQSSQISGPFSVAHSTKSDNGASFRVVCFV